MKRSWAGFAILAVLLVTAAVCSWLMGYIHDPVAADLQQAAELALLGDWEQAEHFSRRARARWDKWEQFRACMADHTPVEEIDADFRALETYRTCREEVSFAALCRSLSRSIAAVGEAHEFVWWNLL